MTTTTKRAMEPKSNSELVKVVNKWSVTLPYRKGDKTIIHKLPHYELFLEEGYGLKVDRKRESKVNPYEFTKEMFLDGEPTEAVIGRLKRGLKAVVKKYEQQTIVTTERVVTV